MTIVGTFASTSINGTANLYVAHTIKTSGFLNSANNLASATVIASGGSASGSYIAVANAGVNETHSGTVTDMTTPASDLYLDSGSGSWAGGHWLIYPFEVWTTNDSLTPIYLKLTYRNATNASHPTIGIAIGIGWDGNANITGSYINLTGSNGPDAAFSTSFSATDGGSTTYECDFAGSAGSFRMIMWRTGGSNTANILNIERGRDASGNAVGTFFTVNAALNLSGTFQQSLFASGSGPSAGGGYNSTAFCTIPVTGSAQTSGTTLCNNIVAALPVFPIVGYVGNPMLNLVTFLASDITEGGQINVVVYGNSHTYLCTKQRTPAVGIRWE